MGLTHNPRDPKMSFPDTFLVLFEYVTVGFGNVSGGLSQYFSSHSSCIL